jgi:hypothetical protein
MKVVKNTRRLVYFLIELALFSAATNNALAVGAATPFTTLEAEAGTLGGGATIHAFTPGSTVPSGPTMELEASGMAYVWLTNLNGSVSWTNPVAGANTIVIRNCIPDAPNGGGITATIDLYVDGVFRQAITLSSQQSWNYRNNPTNTTPDDPNGGGTPWIFYDENRAFITGAPIATGSTIKLQKDAANTATFYDIDCIDLENVLSAKTQPANSLCITNAPYNADPTFTTDSTTGIKNCINAARSQGKTVWIPPGKFMVNNLASGAINLAGVTVEGAGVWYSTIYKNIPASASGSWPCDIQAGTNSVLRDVFIDSNSRYRGQVGESSGITSSGSNWLVQRVWVQHCDAQWMSGSFGTIQDSRVADSWADGINLNNGNTPNSSKLGISLTTSNCFVRGSGDDGLTTYSDSGASGTNPQMQNTRIVNNTSMAGYWANGLRIAGGTNVTVQGNLIDSVAANSGMEVSVFGNTGRPLDSALVSGNVIIRGGGWNGNQYGMHVGSPSSTSYFSNAYTSAIITNNIIRLALRDGLYIGTTHETLTVANNTIDHPAQTGIHVQSGVTGTGDFEFNLVTNVNPGGVAFKNDSPSTFTVILNGNTFLDGEPPMSRAGWVASASVNGSDSPAKAIDGNIATRWSTGGAQSLGQWFQVDMGSAQTFFQIILDQENSTSDYPRGYQVNVSSDGINWGSPVATGSGSSGAATIITFPTQTARYIRVTQTGSTTGNYWSIYEFYTYAPVISLTPTDIAMIVSNNTIALSWPADHLGWRLQVQTNALHAGLGTNWMTLPGSDTITSTNITINPANGMVFYRLISP